MKDATHVTLRKVDSVIRDLEEMRGRIMDRAYEIFCERGRALGNDLEDWLKAESETCWSPPIEVREKDGEYVVEAAIPGVDAKELDLEITSDDLLIRADISHHHREKVGSVETCEFRRGPLFRSIHFHRHVDPTKATASLKNGMLKIHLGLAKDEHPKKIEVEAA
jgi:HSP20 family protein